MAEYGLLIDSFYCTGCHSCEVACRNEKGLGHGQWGIKVVELGPWQMPDGKGWDYRYVTVPTKLCDLCFNRVEQGKLPSCVFHCLADALEFGSIDELAQKLKEHEGMASIFIP